MGRTAADIQLSDLNGDVINPATEDKQDDIITAIGAIGGSIATSVGTFITTVTTAGTPVQLANHPCKRCFVQNISSEISGVDAYIVIGGSSVDYATGEGNLFYATQGDWFNVSNTNLLYVDASVNGAKVSVYYEN